MHIREIEVTNFTNNTRKITLPERGVLLVTGLNGRGKSGCFVAAPAAALYGKSVRKAPPWGKGKSSVRVVTDKVEVTRSRTGSGSAKLVWNPIGAEPVQYDNQTKAQHELSAYLDAWPVWRRIYWLSADTAAKFTDATDKERKQFFEAIIGVDNFDAAAKACRADLAESRTALTTATNKKALHDERAERCVARIAELGADTEEAASKLPPRPERAVVDKLRAAIEAADADVESARRGVRDADKALAVARHRLKTMKEEATRHDYDACPTCGTETDQSKRERLKREYETARGEIEAESESLRADIEKYSAAVKEAQAESRSYSEKLAELRDVHRAWKAHDAWVESLGPKRATAAAELQLHRADAAKEAERVAILSADVDELAVCETVLGLKGVRAQILGNVLRSVSVLANTYLAKLFPGVSLSMDVGFDKVTVDVDGLPHDYGYDGASTGEKRKLDIAILLALGQIVGATHGTGPGTLVLDEVGDGIDHVGMDAFLAMLDDMAADRCVVLISHSEEIKRRINPVKHIHIE